MKNTNMIFYRLICTKLKEKSKNGTIKTKEINCIMGKVFHIPKEDRIKILKDMERLNLLTLKKRTRVEINGIEIR